MNAITKVSIRQTHLFLVVCCFGLFIGSDDKYWKTNIKKKHYNKHTVLGSESVTPSALAIN